MLSIVTVTYIFVTRFWCFFVIYYAYKLGSSCFLLPLSCFSNFSIYFKDLCILLVFFTSKLSILKHRSVICNRMQYKFFVLLYDFDVISQTEDALLNEMVFW